MTDDTGADDDSDELDAEIYEGTISWHFEQLNEELAEFRDVLLDALHEDLDRLLVLYLVIVLLVLVAELAIRYG